MANYGFATSRVIDSIQGNVTCGIGQAGYRYEIYMLPSMFIPYPTVTTSENWYEQNGYFFNPQHVSMQGGWMVPERIYNLFTVGDLKVGVFFYTSIQNGTWADLTSSNVNAFQLVFVEYTEGNSEYVTPENPNGYYIIFEVQSVDAWSVLTSDEYPVPTGEGLTQDQCYISPYLTTNGVIFRTAFNEEHTLTSGWSTHRYEFYKLANGAVYSNDFQVQLTLLNEDGTEFSNENLKKVVTPSSTGGGTGTFDTDSDTIAWAPLPTLGFANSGLGRLYMPTQTELLAFSSWLYSDSILDTLAKLWSDPMDMVISLGIMPYTPTHLGSRRELTIAGVGTGVVMTPIVNQFEYFDCGTININEYYGSSLDYGNYTRIKIYLPYIGVRELKCDEVMGGGVAVRYNIDLATGTCIAQVKCIKTSSEGYVLNAVLYQFEGNMFVQMPLIARDFTQVYQSVIRGVADVASSGNVASAVGGAIDSAINVMATKPNTQKSGGIGASGGYISIKRPYLIIERPIQSLADKYNEFVGYPSNITAKLSTLRGYTEVEVIHLDNFGSATTEELERIKEKLQKGVIL